MAAEPLPGASLLPSPRGPVTLLRQGGARGREEQLWAGGNRGAGLPVAGTEYGQCKSAPHPNCPQQRGPDQHSGAQLVGGRMRGPAASAGPAHLGPSPSPHREVDWPGAGNWHVNKLRWGCSQAAEGESPSSCSSSPRGPLPTDAWEPTPPAH